MAGGGFSHVGVCTHDMEATIDFYENLLGLSRVADSMTRIKQGGTLRQVYFDAGGGQFLVFMEPKGVPGISSTYDTGINGALGVPAGMYHFALRALELDDLQRLSRKLGDHRVDVSPVIDLGHAKSIFFRDPNDLQLEYCYHLRPFEQSDLHQESEASIALPG
jgi:catechol 2,3-dioxygenase-like lactoylglutathione lyase family enzyme